MRGKRKGLRSDVMRTAADNESREVELVIGGE